MKILVDTNVLLRLTQASSPQQFEARSVLMLLEKTGFELCLVPQVLYEYWVVAKRPILVNGLGWLPPQPTDYYSTCWTTILSSRMSGVPSLTGINSSSRKL